MGDPLPFRRRKRPASARFRRPRAGSGWGDAWRSVRPAVLLIFLIAFAVVWSRPDLVGVPDLFSTEPQRVDARWSECGTGYATHCVVDGDTFRIGSASYRVVGFDTPELDARCPREAKLAAEARAALLEWLNRGPFWMRGRFDDPSDRYGRELREVYRKDAAGMRAYVGPELVERGLARRYHGGTREGWCN